MAGETIRDVVVRVALQQIDSKLKVPETATATKALKSYERQVNESSKRASESLMPVSDRLSGITSKTDVARRSQEELSRTIQDESIKSSESLASAGEGALLFARGLTLLGVSADDDMAKVVESLARVQAGIDLLKGTTQIFKGVVEGVRSFSAATKAAAESQAILSATSKGAATSAGLLTAATGPLGLAVLGVTAGVTALGVSWLSTKDSAEESLDAQIEKTRRLEEVSRKFAEAQRKRREEDRTRVEREGKAFDSAFQLAALRGELTLQEKIAAIEKERDRALASANKNTDFEASLKRQFDLGVRQVDLLREQASELSKIAGLRQRDFDKAKAAADQAKRTLDLEKQRTQSLTEKIGSLSGEDALRLKQISQQQAGGGKLSLDQAQFLQSTGIGSGLASKRFAEEGESRGASEILKGLGELAPTERASKQFAEARQQQQKSQDALVAAQRASNDAQDEANERMIAILEESVNSRKDFRKRLEQIESDLQESRLAGR